MTRDEFAEAMLPLALYVGRRVCRGLPHLRDEGESVALVALAIAVNRVQSRDGCLECHELTRAFVGKVVADAVRDYLREPQHRHSAPSPPPAHAGHAWVRPEYPVRFDGRRGWTEPGDRVEAEAPWDDVAAFDAADSFDWICRPEAGADAAWADLLHLRFRDGLGVAEIAGSAGVHRNTVWERTSAALALVRERALATA